jgi:hypothetical protein
MSEAISSATIVAATRVIILMNGFYGLGSYECAKRRESGGETDHDKTDHCR